MTATGVGVPLHSLQLLTETTIMRESAPINYFILTGIYTARSNHLRFGSN